MRPPPPPHTPPSAACAAEVAGNHSSSCIAFKLGHQTGQAGWGPMIRPLGGLNATPRKQRNFKTLASGWYISTCRSPK